MTKNILLIYFCHCKSICNTGKWFSDRGLKRNPVKSLHLNMLRVPAVLFQISAKTLCWQLTKGAKRNQMDNSVIVLLLSYFLSVGFWPSTS